MAISNGSGIAAHVGDTAVAVELGNEVKLPSAWRIRQGQQAFVTVHERLLTQAVVDGHLHIGIAESSRNIKVFEQLIVQLDLGAVGIRFPVEVIDADLVSIGIAVKDNLVDEVGAVGIQQKLDFLFSHIEMLGDVYAIVPCLFHLRLFQEPDGS